MKKDPYNLKDRFDKWISSVKDKKSIEGLNEGHSKLLLSFIRDFNLGLNISNQSKKGKRSYPRLLNYRHKLSFIMRQLEKRGLKDIRHAKAEDLHNIFNDMREGKIKKTTGSIYKSTGDYVKSIKAFWHWHMKVMRKQGKVVVMDITEDLDTRGEKPKFVYFTQEDCEKIIDKASYDLKPSLALVFDSGVRVTELMNIKVSDFSNDFKELNIREETSKTFGRKIKLMLCTGQIKAYVKAVGLKPEDYICKIGVAMTNRELRRLGKEVLRTEQVKYKNLTLYDFRHSSACFWLPRYKSESALKYRFGWKKSDMIHYYTEFLGMKDTINEEDMYVDVTKTELEKEIRQLKKESRAQRQETKTVWKRLDVQDAKINIMIEAAREDKKTGGSFDKHLRKVYLERGKKKHI